MSAPVINTTTSVLGYKQWESWEYQPYATNTPTSWACPNLPAGLSIDTSTGKVSGAASVAGVFVCGLTATNADGTSSPLVLTIGIESANAALTSSGYEVNIDVATREISFTAAAASTTAAAPAAAAPNLYAKEGDSLLLWISFVKNGQALDLDIQTLAIAVKEFEPEARLVLGDAWKKYGTGTGAYYGLYAAISGVDLASALGNYEADGGTAFDGLAEIEWQEANADHADAFGPENFRFTTRDFKLTIARDMAEEA
ncbi:MAG: Ig domain-containing protein [Verrucomicrobiae bacterium]